MISMLRFTQPHNLQGNNGARKGFFQRGSGPAQPQIDSFPRNQNDLGISNDGKNFEIGSKLKKGASGGRAWALYCFDPGAQPRVSQYGRFGAVLHDLSIYIGLE